MIPVVLLVLALLPSIAPLVHAQNLTLFRIDCKVCSVSPGGTAHYVLNIHQYYSGYDIIQMYALVHSVSISHWYTDPSNGIDTNGPNDYKMDLYIVVSSSATPGTYTDNTAYIDSYYYPYYAYNSTTLTVT